MMEARELRFFSQCPHLRSSPDCPPPTARARTRAYVLLKRTNRDHSSSPRRHRSCMLMSSGSSQRRPRCSNRRRRRRRRRRRGHGPAQGVRSKAANMTTCTISVDGLFWVLLRLVGSCWRGTTWRPEAQKEREVNTIQYTSMIARAPFTRPVHCSTTNRLD